MNEDDPVDAIEELAKRKLQSRIGVRKELKRLPDKLEHGEEVVTLASGQFESTLGLLALTNRRLMFLDQGRFRDKVEEFPYDRIASIQTEKKMMSGKLKLYVAGGGRHEITDVVPKERVDEIASYVRQRTSPGAPSEAGAAEPPRVEKRTAACRKRG